MFEAPDRRALYLFGTVGLVFVASTLIDPTSSLARPVDVALYLSIIGFGLAFAYLNLKGGYCLNRPSITREGAPMLFWLEVSVSLALSGFGAWMLWQSVRT